MQSRAKIALGSICVLIGLGLLLRFKNPYYEAVKPSGITNIAGHFERWGFPKSIYRRNHSGTNILILIGLRLTNSLPSALPSGPPAYVYSEKGALLDWSYDIGDDSRIHQKWGNLVRHEADERLTAEDLKSLFNLPIKSAKDVRNHNCNSMVAMLRSFYDASSATPAHR